MTVITSKLNDLHVDHLPGKGPKILFLHGAHAGSWYWHNFLRYFAEAGYEPYAMNLRGHYTNPRLADLGRVTLADYVEDVKGVARALGGEVILVGHSLGGVVAQLAAAELPLRAAVFASPGPVAGVRFQRPNLGLRGTLRSLGMLPALLRRRPMLPSRWATVKTVLNKMPPSQHDAFYSRLGPESATAALQILKGLCAADLTRVSFPKLVISGAEDLAVLPAMVREIAARQGADLIELAGHGHAFMLEPGWQGCAARLAGWLNEKLAAVPAAPPVRVESSAGR